MELQFPNSPSIPPSGTALIDANTCNVFTFSRRQNKVTIQNHPENSATLYIRWNADYASATDWDLVIIANAAIESPKDITVDKVAIYSKDAASTLGTNFSVRGLL